VALRAKGLSFREIAEYSAKHYKVKVHKETIRRLFESLKDAA